MVNAASPVQRRSGGGGGRRRRSSGGKRRRSRSKGGASGGNLQSRMQNLALGGLGYGLLKKNWPNMPRVPGLGNAGTVALAGYFLKPSNSLLQNIALAAAVIAGYSFGESGTVAGDDDVLASET